MVARAVEKEAAAKEVVRAVVVTEVAVMGVGRAAERAEGMACEQKSVHTSVSLGLREHGKKHERDERWEKEMSLLLQVVVDPLLCDEADDE